MIALQGLVLLILAAVLAVWVYRCYLIHSTRGRGPVLDASCYPDLQDAGLVSVIVPAKDEEKNIGAALETILAQDYRNLEVIVVDDRSADGTADVVRRFAARDARVRLAQVEALPEGWFGKTHAMYTGARQARGEWLLFVDADCRQAPHSVRAGVGFLLDRQGDMLSLWPVLEMHGFWENAVQPVAASVLVAWFRPQWVNDPRRRTAFANGQYILIRRAVYEAVGGHEAVKSEIVEDIAFARRVKAAGHRLLNAIGKDLFTTRMYDSLRAMWRGWTRIFSGGFRPGVWLAAVISLTFLFALAPFLVLAASVAALAAGAGGTWTAAVVALSAATVLAVLVTMRRYFMVGRANPWYLFFYPAAVLLTIGFEATAIVRAIGIGAVTWRGTTYKGGKVVGGGGR